MLIREFVDTGTVADKDKLLAMTVFLSDRAKDENARKEISSDAFIDLAKSLKRKTLIILISDLIDNSSYQKALKILKIRHDILVVRCLDQGEQKIAQVGLLPIVDPETGETAFLDARKNQKLNLPFHLSS